MYLHNAVEGHPEMSKSQFLENLKKVFEFYEEKRKEGKIRFYGLATWECFRATFDNAMFLSLEDVMGHSLGAQVILSTVESLAKNSENNGIIESVHLFGASIPANSSPSVGLLQFIRSTPGVLAPLIGQKSNTHVELH